MVVKTNDRRSSPLLSGFGNQHKGGHRGFLSRMKNHLLHHEVTLIGFSNHRRLGGPGAGSIMEHFHQTCSHPLFPGSQVLEDILGKGIGKERFPAYLADRRPHRPNIGLIGRTIRSHRHRNGKRRGCCLSLPMEGHGAPAGQSAKLSEEMAAIRTMEDGFLRRITRFHEAAFLGHSGSN